MTSWPAGSACSQDPVWRLRLAGWLCTIRWAAAAQALTDLVDAVPRAGEALLWRLGVGVCAKTKQYAVKGS